MPNDAQSSTNILNTALARIGSTERVTSIDDTTSNSAKRANLVWDQLRRALMVRHPWNFAVMRAVLNEAGTTPLFGWKHQYAVPANCLRWLPPAEGEDGYFDGEREGDYILTDREAPLPASLSTLPMSLSGVLGSSPRWKWRLPRSWRRR
jgi:hypothetical protein